MDGGRETEGDGGREVGRERQRQRQSQRALARQPLSKSLGAPTDSHVAVSHKEIMYYMYVICTYYILFYYCILSYTISMLMGSHYAYSFSCSALPLSSWYAYSAHTSLRPRDLRPSPAHIGPCNACHRAAPETTPLWRLFLINLSLSLSLSLLRAAPVLRLSANQTSWPRSLSILFQSFFFYS